MIGEVVSHYEIVQRVGKGGMGVVYKARDLRLDRDVALKFLPRELSDQAEKKQRFVQEARAASVLDHANICTIHEVGEKDDGQLFIAMSYYEGDTIKELIARGPLEVSQIIDLARQIAAGLGAAHNRGLTHLDIKPANILVTPKGNVKILDFGLAQFAGEAPELSSSGAVMGTVAYMAPERVMGQEVTPLTDIWAVGAVLYEMATGRKPFRAGSKMEVLYAIVRDDPPAPRDLRPDLEPDLNDIILKMLVKDREDRYQTLREVEKDLASLVETDTTESAPIPPPPPPWRWPTLSIVAGVLLVVAFFFVIVRPPELDGRNGVTMIGFQQSSGVPPWMDLALAELLPLQLPASPRLRWREAKGVTTRGFDSEQGLAERDLARIAESSEASLVLGGLLRAEKDEIVVEVMVQEARTGIVVKHLEARGPSGQILTVAADLAADLSRFFRVSVRPTTTEDEPPPGSEEDKLWQTAQAFLKYADSPGARDSLLKGLGSGKPFAPIQLRLADAYLDLGRTKPALEEAGAGLAMRKISSRHQILLHVCTLAARGELVRAASLLEALWAAPFGSGPELETRLDDGIRLAFSWSRAGRLERAEEILQSLPVSVTPDPRLGLLHSALAGYQARYADQIAIAQSTATQARRDDLQLVLSWASLFQGHAYLRLDQLANARIALENSHAIFVAKGHPRGEAEASILLGELALAKNDPAAADALFEDAVQIYQALNAIEPKAFAVAWRALVEKQRGDDGAEARLLEQAEQLLVERQVGNHALRAWISVQRAQLEMRRGQLGKAQEQLQVAQGLLTDFESPRIEALLISTLGELLLHQGALAQANRELDQALKRQKEIGEPREIARTLLRQGLLYQHQGYLQQAEEAWQSALDTTSQPALRLAASTGLAEAHLMGGRPEEALEILAEPLRQGREATLEPSLLAAAELVQAESLLWAGQAAGVSQEGLEVVARNALSRLPPTEVLLQVKARRVLADILMSQESLARIEIAEARRLLGDEPSPLQDLPISILEARLIDDDATATRSALQQLLGRAAGLPFWESMVRLALGEMEMQAGSDRRLSILLDDARANGWGLVERRAAEALSGPSQP